MKNIKFSIAAILVGITFFVSCDSRTQQDLEGVVLNPTYTANVKPILDNLCVNCHSQNGQQYFPSLDTYQNVVDYQHDNGANGYSQGAQGAPSLLCSIQASSCTADRMPKSGAPLSSSSITTITNWVNNGYPQ